VEDRVLRLHLATRQGATQLARALQREGLSISHSTVHRILRGHGRIVDENPDAASWINQVFLAADPLPKIERDVPSVPHPSGFAEQLRRGSLRDRQKATAVLARLKGIRLCTVARCLDLTVHSVIRYTNTFAAGGLKALFRRKKSKVDDEPYRGPIFALLHSPPSAYNINRTTWKMEDLHRVLAGKGLRLSEHRIRRIIKSAGFRWRRAKVVLTSNDPEYEAKLEAIKKILSELKPDEAFFSVDEYGPFAVKMKGGKKRVGPAEKYIVPQWQKSKGWMIITAALELSRNQVTHFYSRKKNTDEMIKMADLLRCQYRSCSRIYLSWDAASWHMSKQLLEYLKTVNAEAVRDGFPIIETAPLPAGAQFLNVIESIFSGMARAIMHNSDYPSLDAAQNAINRYFRERNKYFSLNPRRAGNKIWGKERVPSNFHEGQNCKDPAYR
jgi:transposase